jgi:hypothetical protein
MTRPATNSNVHEFCSPARDASARVVGVAVDRATRETILRWRVSRLFWVKDALPPAMRQRHAPRDAESSKPEPLGFRCWSGDVDVDVRSPLADGAFHAMPFAEQVDYLRMWQPETPNWDGPTREGLAGIFQAEVEAQPVFYFKHASQFTGLDPVYATALVRGFLEGLAGKTVSNWGPFWVFASWVLAQSDPEAEIQDEFSGETQLGRRWQDCRLEIARFLDATLNDKLASLPLTERAAVWQLIEALTRDPNPAPADEAPEGKCRMDPFTLSLNTVRGEAMHAVFSFIHWIRSHSPEAAQSDGNLDDVPEARAAFEARLDAQLEPSLTIRSVFGANIPRLAHWAEVWLGEHLEEIFPAHGQSELRDIAWGTYLRFSHVNSRAFALLRQQYTAAIAKIPQDGLVEPRDRDARVSLGQHLVLYYCRGGLDFEQPGDLLATFFARAPEPVRAEVLAFVGRSLTQSHEPIPPEVFARLLKLWNWQVQRETTPGGAGLQHEVA